jgi:glutamate synthase (NADPH) large chain
VILGKTGRNFAAGMSGGIAFVYDEDGNFAARCNRGMVDLKACTRRAERAALMLERHVQYTGSTVAKRILENWDAEITNFVRVMPRDYARVLREEMPKARHRPCKPEMADGM